MVAIEDGRVVGTCRLVFREEAARLGRMAVEPKRRGRGIGAELLRRADRVARDARATRITLHAQLPALALYERAGYVRRGAEVVGEGIPHVAMEKPLA